MIKTKKTGLKLIVCLFAITNILFLVQTNSFAIVTAYFEGRFPGIKAQIGVGSHWNTKVTAIDYSDPYGSHYGPKFESSTDITGGEEWLWDNTWYLTIWGLNRGYGILYNFYITVNGINYYSPQGGIPVYWRLHNYAHITMPSDPNAPIPEPATMLLLGTGLLGLLGFKRKKKV